MVMLAGMSTLLFLALSTSAASTAVVTSVNGEGTRIGEAGEEPLAAPASLGGWDCLSLERGATAVVFHDGVSAELTGPGLFCHEDLPTPEARVGRSGVKSRVGASRATKGSKHGGTKGSRRRARQSHPAVGVHDVAVEGPLSRRVVAKRVRGIQHQLGYCHSRQWEDPPVSPATLPIALTIASDGAVSAVVGESTLDHDGVESCVVSRLEWLSFAEEDGSSPSLASFELQLDSD